MDSSPVTNEMLYELLKEFKRDVSQRFEQQDNRFGQQDNRFEQQDKHLNEFKRDVFQRFEQQDRRLEQQEKRIDDVVYELREIKSILREDQKKLQEVYESRDRVTVRFTRAWGFASLFAGVMGGFIAFVLIRVTA